MSESDLTSNNVEIKIKSFINRYRKLNDKANEILFSWWSIKQLETPRCENLANWQKTLYEISAPYGSVTTESSFNTLKLIFLLTWWFTEIVWVELAGFILLNVSQNNYLPSSPNTTNPFVQGFSIFILVILPILIYGHTIWYLSTRRNTKFTKLIWLTSLVLILIYAFISTAKIPIEALSRVALFDEFWILAFLIVSPAILVANYGILYFAKFIIEFLNNFLNVLSRSFQPIAYSAITDLLKAELDSDGVKWTLSHSNKDEITALRDFAKANLEASEKRTIPMAIIIAVLGFFGALPYFSNLLSNFFQNLLLTILQMFSFTPTQNTSLLHLFIYGLGAALFLILTTGLLLSFRNLITQGIIIQACNVAIHINSKPPEQEGQTNITNNLFGHIMKTIKRMFSKNK